MNWLGPPPTWTPTEWFITLSNPIFCMFAPDLDPSQNMLGAQAVFLGATALVSLGLVIVAARNIRRVALGQASRPARVERPGFAGKLIARLPEPSLEGNPVLWREWHRKRPSRWAGRLWTTYAVVSFLATLGVIAGYYLTAGWNDADMAGFVNGWQVAIGLLLLSISAPMALAEERDRGSLDVVMTTPLTTRTIVWGKWLGTFAVVPRLAILPVWMVVALAMVSGRWADPLLLAVTIFAPAAAITSLGLALATWIPRPSRAVAASLLSYVLMTIGSSIFLGVLGYPGSRASFFGTYFGWPVNFWDMLAGLNPFWGVRAVTQDAGRLSYWNSMFVNQHFFDLAEPDGTAARELFLGVGAHLAIAAAALAATLLTFDRCLGRVADRARPARGRRPGTSPEGAVIGAIGGALAGFVVIGALSGIAEIASVPLAAVIVSAFGALFGAAAGGRLIGLTGWFMIVGALLGTAAAVIVIALAAPQVSGVGGGALLGAPPGLIIGLLVGLRREKARVARPT
jgi:ABC-type transport system involved in multi-copper enzyme maturation permease subunit